MTEKFPKFPIISLSIAGLISACVITHYIVVGGPHMIHYLRCNFYIPGLRYVYFSKHQLYYSLSDVIQTAPLNEAVRKNMETARNCEESGCKDIRDFDPNAAPEIFQWMKTFTCRKVKHEPYNHFCLRPYSGDQMSFAWTMFGYYELHYRNAIMELLTLFPDAGLLDVGTNIGSHSLLVAAMGRQVRAFDANPFNLKIQHRSIEINGFGSADPDPSSRIRIFWNAISSQNGNITVKWKNGNNLEGNSRVCDDERCADEQRHATGEVFEVPAVTLNDIAVFIASEAATSNKDKSPSRKPWILKIDIEGSEPAAIMKSDLLLGTDPLNFVPVMLMEYRVAYLASRTRAREMVRLFYEFGYCPYGYVPFMTAYYRIENTYYEDWPHDIILIKQSDICNRHTLKAAEDVILGQVPTDEKPEAEWS